MNAVPQAAQSFAYAKWGGDDAQGHAVFSIEGMRCAGCSGSVERAVRALPGVERISVNVATARAAVDWHSERVSLDRILEAIRKAGFKPVPLSGEAAALSQRDERRAMIKRVGVAGLGMMQVMMFMYGLYAAGSRGIDAQIEQYLRLISMLVATPVMFYSGAAFFRGAWRDLRMRTLGMDVPVALALALAYIASVVNTLRGAGEIYFDSVTMFVFFLLAGRFVEMAVRHRSLSSTEALARSLPATAARVRSDGQTERVPLEQIVTGDRLLVAKGGVFPVDALLEDTDTLVDESLVTGESVPVTRQSGDKLLGGSLNIGQAVKVTAHAGVRDSMLASIVGLLDRAQAERPPVMRAADRTASWFVGVVLLLALGVAGVWLFIEPGRALAAALAVLVVTCPCALSLATPAAIAAATTRLARAGLLVTRPDALESLARIDTVVIDKTGTLTMGLPVLNAVETCNDFSRDRALAIAAALERASAHPIAAAFASFTDPGLVATDVREVAGQGIEGRIADDVWRLGRPEFVSAIIARGPAGNPPHGADNLVAADQGILLGKADGMAASFALVDSIRADASEGIEALRAQGLEIAIASGDREQTVQQLARRLGIEQAMGRMTPEQKLLSVRERQLQGHRALMIGDGINDGPVLAAAHVSCAMGQGSAVAHAAADLLLLNDSLGSVAEGVRTARHMLVVMRQNLRWAFLYNMAAVPLAALGWVPPWVAAIGMSLSSLGVVLNAHRLARLPVHTRIAA